MHPVVRISWVESERGWGIRPDGYSLHLSNAHADEYISRIRELETRGKPPGYVPDEYSRENSRTLTDVDDQTYDDLVKAGGTLRFYS